MQLPSIVASLKSNKKANGKQSVNILICFDNQREWISTGHSVLKEDWYQEERRCYISESEKKRGCAAKGIKPTNKTIEPRANQINNSINEWTGKGKIIIEGIEGQAKLQGLGVFPVSAEELKRRLIEQVNPDKKGKTKAQTSDKYLFFPWCDRLCAELEQKGDIGLMKSYKAAKNKLRDWYGRDDLKFTDINKGLLLGFYESHLINKLNNKLSTAHTTMRMLKTMYRKARKSNEMGFLKDYPDGFEGVSVKNSNPERAKKLTRDDIKAIAALKLEPGSKLDKARDVFLFCLYSLGMRVRDAINLRWESFANDMKTLNYAEGKTGKRKTVSVNDRMAQILGKYGLQKSGYVFGFMPEDNQNVKKGYNSASSVTTLINRHLKDIGQLANVSIGAENLTTHVARHSFADVLYSNSKDVLKLQQALNHGSLKTTQAYLKQNIVDNDPVITQALDSIFQ